MPIKSQIAVNSSNKATYDGILIGLFFIILIFGWFVKVAATPATSWSEVSIWDFKTAVGMQTFWTIASILVFFSVLLIEKKIWNVFSLPIYITSIFFLILVLLVGDEINGAKAWLNFGGFSFQPVEFAKFATCLSLANYLANPSVKVTSVRSMLIGFSIILIPVMFILLQPDVGSALVFFAFSFVLFRHGLSIWPFVVILLLGFVFIMTLSFNVYSTLAMLLLMLMFVYASQYKFSYYWIGSILLLAFANIVFIWNELHLLILLIDCVFAVVMTFLTIREGKLRLVTFVTSTLLVLSSLSYATSYAFYNILKPHQQDRLNVWLHPERCDPRGSLYNVVLSKMAISSGGFDGKGYMQGTLTKLNYVPEHTTDFIFCIVGEEQGFVGSVIILGLFLFLILRILYLSERSGTRFVTSFGYGFAGVLFVHVFVNIGMTLGLVPVIGIPLPFISFGGSALLGFTLMYAVFVNISRKNI